MAKGLNTARVRTTINTDILERIVGRKQDIPDLILLFNIIQSEFWALELV
jgi:hypothetical protein